MQFGGGIGAGKRNVKRTLQRRVGWSRWVGMAATVAMNAAVDLQVFRRRRWIENFQRARVFGILVVRIAIVNAVSAPQIGDVDRYHHCGNGRQCWYNLGIVSLAWTYQ